MAPENIDVTGTSVLNEIFDNAIDEVTPAVETPPAEEVPAIEESAPVAEEPEKAEETTPPAGKVPAGYVPIPVHAELRVKSRKAEEALRQQLSAAQIAQAKAEARAELLEQMATKAQMQPAAPSAPPEKSPLEKFEEEYPGEAVTTKVLLEQRKWDQIQTSQQVAQDQLKTRGQLITEGLAAARNTYSAERMGSEELTLDAVVGLAKSHGLITTEDVNNLAPYGNKAGMVLYNLAATAIKQAGGAPLQELNRRIVVARQTLADKNGKQTTKPTPPPAPVVPAAKGGKQPTTKSDDDDTDANVSGITNFMFRK